MVEEKKEIRYGARVVDSEGKVLGTVDHVARDSWTGEVGKFIVRQKPPAKDIFLEPTDVDEVNEGEVKLNRAVSQG
jgi:sporulation protein YlmC with PRC-barrel domain